MIELLQISRGGSGGVTGAKILAEAALYEGVESQAIPKYGSERRGAAVEAYVRFDEKPIRIHSPVVEPDIAMVLDTSLIDRLDLSKIKQEGIIIINSKITPSLGMTIATPPMLKRKSWVIASESLPVSIRVPHESP